MQRAQVAARAAGWAAWIVPLLVYALSLKSAPAFWDTGEAQTVPWIFGIMHPTGFPAFVVLAGAFAHAFALGSVAWRIALFCALAMSGAAWLLSRLLLLLERSPWIAAGTSWLFAFGFIAWQHGTRAEVHALTIFFAVLTLYASVRWHKRGEGRWAIIAAGAFGLGIATHPIVGFLLPAIALLLLGTRARPNARVLVAAGMAFLIGVLPYVYLPVRSAMVNARHLDPARSIGLPAGNAFWDSDDPARWDGFSRLVTGSDFSAGGTLKRMATREAYARGLPRYGAAAAQEFTWFGLVLALAGLVILLLEQRLLAIALLLAFAAPLAFICAYTIEGDPTRYYLIPFAITALLAGYAAATLTRARRPLRIAAVLVVAALAGGRLVSNRAFFQQPRDPGAAPLIQSVLRHTPANAILVASWFNATPLAYAIYVEHRGERRIVVSAWLGEVARDVPAWERQRPVYVVGAGWGSVPGYQVVPIAGTAIARVVKADARASESY